MRKNRMLPLVPIVVLVSFLGFCVENVWLSVTKGYMDNRNMHLPFLLGYGLAVAAICFLFGTPQEPRLLGISLSLPRRWQRTACYYGICCLCVMAGEIALGTFVEQATGIVWWNYSALPLHITKYTSVPTTLAFAALITGFMAWCFPPLYTYFARWEPKKLEVFSFCLLTLLTADFLHSARWMFKTRQILRLWRFHVPAFTLVGLGK